MWSENDTLDASGGIDYDQAERYPIGARVLRNTIASIILRREDERTKTLRDTMAEFRCRSGTIAERNLFTPLLSRFAGFKRF
ncbi:hypothetical protein H7849_16090 [Alloacidobacterium dinghuense]|uniref:Uncharacterized protein n=1 Tax=Alloacidobacterium dinghuense TaxID=2763107 RepID=A0A7G8BDN0_9BACT|nr:hypothetical protein [Alloacidobacterium dinghuense]QNI30650.1 hypothetical protein H7849_16090 [Alloacidobacterium dinghuense]